MLGCKQSLPLGYEENSNCLFPSQHLVDFSTQALLPFLLLLIYNILVNINFNPRNL
tara:strand:- start:1587 stop:1754 length:168 start_codon:yes stop_codon:yes gene_type:complete